jgi:hypothetical protein
MGMRGGKRLMTGAGIDNARNKECSAAAMTQKAPTCATHDHNRKPVNTSNRNPVETSNRNPVNTSNRNPVNTSPAHGVQGAQ